MSWADFYLFCFLFGFFFSVVAALSGHFHLDFHNHHGGGFDAGHGGHHGGMAGHHHGGLGSHHADGGHVGDHHGGRVVVSPFNMGTIAAFLAWFGGAGYIATHFYKVWVVAALGVSAFAGLAGAGVVYMFLSRVLMRNREEMDPADYDLVGVLAKVSSAIRRDGIGEVLYSQDGARRSVAARSEDGTAITSGSEVVVTRFENGVAYVRRWDDMAKSAGA